MPDSVRLVDYFYTVAGNRPGEGARALGHLRDAGVNLLAFHGFPTGRRSQLVFVPADPAAFRRAARAARWAVKGPKKAFIIEGDDRVGALVGAFEGLARAGVNVTANSAVVAGAGRFGAILWVKPRDVRRAARTLGAG